jgi:hypothetical protein
MKKEKIREIAKEIVNGLDVGVNFISWQDIVSYVRDAADSDASDADIANYTNQVVSEILTLCNRQGITYYFGGEIYLYHGEYERAKKDGLTMIKFFRPDLERVKRLFESDLIDEIKTEKHRFIREADNTWTIYDEETHRTENLTKEQALERLIKMVTEKNYSLLQSYTYLI